jgi:hypothetical protein
MYLYTEGSVCALQVKQLLLRQQQHLQRPQVLLVSTGW